MPAVRRRSRHVVRAWRKFEQFERTSSIAQADVEIARGRRGRAWEVDERSRVRDAEIRGTRHRARRASDAFDDRHRTALHLQPARVERDRKHCAAQRVDEMTRPEVTPVAAGGHQRRSFLGGERLRHDLRRFPSIRGRAGREREEHVCRRRAESPDSAQSRPPSPSRSIQACRHPGTLAALPPPPWLNTMPSGPQLRPKGLAARQIVTAAPPRTEICLSDPSLEAQKAIDWPSGENTGLVTD